MYICLCRSITEKQIRQAADDGVCTMRELCKQLGVAKQCGKCGHHARQVLNEANNQQSFPKEDLNKS